LPFIKIIPKLFPEHCKGKEKLKFLPILGIIVGTKIQNPGPPFQNSFRFVEKFLLNFIENRFLED